MLPRHIHHVLGLFLLIGSLLLLLWGVWPPSQNRIEINASPETERAGLPAGDYHLILVWTERLRLGDAGTIRATLSERGLDRQVHWTALARLDLPGVQLAPSDTIQSPRLSEEPVSFIWTIRSRSPGRFSGRVWIYVQPAAGLSGGGESDPGRSPLAALPVEVQVSGPYRLSGIAARAAGIIGVCAGLGLFLDRLISFLRRREG